MKKFTYLVLGIVAFSFYSCSKQGDQGPQGTAGVAGSQGGSLGYYWIPGYIPFNSFQGTANNYVYYHRLPTFDIYTSSLVDVIFTIDNTSNPKAVWYGMPATDVFETGDQLSFKVGHDTLEILYNGGSLPLYQINYIADIVPQPQ